LLKRGGGGDRTLQAELGLRSQLWAASCLCKPRSWRRVSSYQNCACVCSSFSS